MERSKTSYHVIISLSAYFARVLVTWGDIKKYSPCWSHGKKKDFSRRDARSESACDHVEKKIPSISVAFNEIGLARSAESKKKGRKGARLKRGIATKFLASYMRRKYISSAFRTREKFTNFLFNRYIYYSRVIPAQNKISWQTLQFVQEIQGIGRLFKFSSSRVITARRGRK